MRRVFVDTGGFYAFTDADDEFHEKACTLFDKASAESRILTTTNLRGGRNSCLDTLSPG